VSGGGRFRFLDNPFNNFGGNFGNFGFWNR
jgi:hypothetical protein